jgi:hypothetical protein
MFDLSKITATDDTFFISTDKLVIHTFYDNYGSTVKPVLDNIGVEYFENDDIITINAIDLKSRLETI